MRTCRSCCITFAVRGERCPGQVTPPLISLLPHACATQAFSAFTHCYQFHSLRSSATPYRNNVGHQDSNITLGVHCAVNCYFRDVCEPTADSSDLWDFQLRSLLPKPVEPPREGVLDEATDAGCSEGVDTGIGIDILPVPVLEHILRSVGAADVCNVAQTCKTLANAARSDLVSPLLAGTLIISSASYPLSSFCCSACFLLTHYLLWTYSETHCDAAGMETFVRTAVGSATFQQCPRI
jgi:hypothetical protein